MKKRIFPLLLCLALLVSALSLGVFAAEEEVYTAEIMQAYGGANGIVSMTFDDGDRATNTWLNQVFEEYDLYGSTMTIVKKNLNITETTDENGETVYVPDQSYLDFWKNIYTNGRLEPESHTYTHLVLPSDSWAQSNQESTPNSLANNTAENYNKELVVSKQLIKDILGYDAICLAPSNNTLSDGAMEEVVKKTYYAVRQGKKINGLRLQSLDPVPGSHEGGGWYNLWMHSFGNNNHQGIREIIPQAVDEAATNGGWLISLCHGIGESSGDAYYSEALPVFQKMSEYQKSGQLWVTTFGRATRYVRERQNSTVSYSYTENKVTVEVTMAEMTADGLPLTASVFNHPLTVRIELPLAVERVAYLLNGETETAETFLLDGKNYAYVNVVPNSGEVEISRIAKGGIFSASDLVAALDKDGEYTVAGNITLNNLIDLTVDAKNVTIDLAGSTLIFKGKNSFVVPEGASLTIKNGNIVIAHSYKGTSNKGLRTYKPITKGEDGTYTLGSAVSIADAGIITGDDLKQTLSAPAFSVKGGNVTLAGVSLERSVAVSNGGELLSIVAGGVTLQNSKLFESVGAESWANADTRLIYMERGSVPTKLIVKNSSIHVAEPNSYYNGMLLCEDGPDAIDASTGAITNEKYTTDSGDNIRICYISGAEDNTGVEILIENSTLQARHSAFRSQTNYSSLDTFTMKDSRMLNTAKANYKEVGFELYSADLVFENCYLAMQDNIIFMNPYSDRYLGQGTSSLVMKQCYVTGTHAIRYASVNNDIYLEDCYFDNGLMGWTGYDGKSEIAPPVIRIAGAFYTKAPIADTPPVYGEGTWTSNSAKNYWVNLQKTNDTDTIVSGVPNWAFSVRHANGTVSVVDAKSSTPYELKAGDVITVWNSYTASPVLVKTQEQIPVITYGLELCLAKVGEGEVVPVDGKLGPISVIDANGVEAIYMNGDANNFANTFSTLVTGQTIVLHADARVDAIAKPKAGQKVAIDLNGYTLYHATAGETVARIEPMLGTEKTGDTIYIYSSREGGRLMNGYQEDKGGCILQTRGGGNIYVGFGPDGKARGERISMYSSMMIRLNKGSAYFNNVDMYVIAGDNNSAFVYQDNAGGNREVRCYGCNIYLSSLPYLIYYRCILDAKTYTLFENTNVYATSNSKKLIYSNHTAGPITTVQDIVFRDANVYYLTMNTEADEYKGKIRAVCEGDCVMSAPLTENFTVAPGHSIQTVNKSVELSGITYPFAALYGGEAKTTLNRSYAYKLVVSPEKEYLNSLYTNIALDTALDLHLYIPKDETVTSVMADGVELLDKKVTETIGTKDYYVVTISKAPKHAAATVQIAITKGTKTYYLEHSLVNYAKNLLSMDESKVSEASRAYLADSKEMMRYALQYAKEVITAYGDPAELDEINALLGTFALTDADKVLENVKENLPSGTGVSAAFDLDSKVGFALGVANTFTGKVTVNIGEDTVSGEYTGDATANGDIVDVLLIPNILAYRLYAMDVTITVEGENAGIAVNTTFTYNLATYVNSGVSGNVGTALYAYAKAAKTYGEKHTVGTID